MRLLKVIRLVAPAVTLRVILGHRSALYQEVMRPAHRDTGIPHLIPRLPKARPVPDNIYPAVFNGLKLDARIALRYGNANLG